MEEEGNGAASVFCDTDGGWLRKSNFTRRSFDRALRRAGLLKERKDAGKSKPRFHDLRHTCATILFLADVNPKVVSELPRARLHRDYSEHIQPRTSLTPGAGRREAGSHRRPDGPDRGRFLRLAIYWLQTRWIHC